MSRSRERTEVAITGAWRAGRAGGRQQLAWAATAFRFRTGFASESLGLDGAIQRECEQHANPERAVKA